MITAGIIYFYLFSTAILFHIVPNTNKKWLKAVVKIMFWVAFILMFLMWPAQKFHLIHFLHNMKPGLF